MSTVPSETSSQDFTGNGVTVLFPLTYPIQAKSHLVVKLKLSGSSVWTTQVLGTNYDVDAAPSDAPTVTMVVAPPAASTLRIERTVPITQVVNLLTAGPFSPSTHTEMHDKRTMVEQQLVRRIAALEELGSLIPGATYVSTLVSKTFTADPADVDAAFPLALALPVGLGTVTGVNVVKVVNNSNPATLMKEPVWAHWATNTAISLSLRYLSGLEPGVNYTITFEVITKAVSP